MKNIVIRVIPYQLYLHISQKNNIYYSQIKNVTY